MRAYNENVQQQCTAVKNEALTSWPPGGLLGKKDSARGDSDRKQGEGGNKLEGRGNTVSAKKERTGETNAEATAMMGVRREGGRRDG